MSQLISIKNQISNTKSTIREVIQKLDHAEFKVIFLIDEFGILKGSVTDGDIRRAFIKRNNLNVDTLASVIMNEKMKLILQGHEDDQISNEDWLRFKALPIVDDKGLLIGLKTNSKQQFQIGSETIGTNFDTFVIAEIGNNHNGSYELGKKLIDNAVSAGANCVKFQMRDIKSLYRSSAVDMDLGVEYTMNLLRKFELSTDNMYRLFDYASRKGVIPICTPFDEKSLENLEGYGMDGYKLASADLTNHTLIKCLISTGKPLICSTGMSLEEEIIDTTNLLRRSNVDFALLHCNSTYPAPFRDLHLRYMERLKGIGQCPVGYSGHERGIEVPVAAVSLGASIIEKHFTLDKTLEGNDHKVSLLPNEFREMVNMIRNVKEAIGGTGARTLTQGEMINRQSLAKSLVFSNEVSAGEIITRDDLMIRSPGIGIQPNRIDEFIGKVAQKSYKKDDYLFESDFLINVTEKLNFSFNRKYGIPIRYHDYIRFTNRYNLDFVEFHLSYNDLDVNIADVFDEASELGYAVHCPELFANDHLLDLASEDETYVKESIKNIERTIRVTKRIGKYFPNQKQPIFILNVGGWNTGGFVSETERRVLYERTQRNLAKIDFSDVRLAIQTMPPFPWHFGGQSHHNLFVRPDEIVSFCEDTGHEICLDVSHSMMSCNYLGIDLGDFVHKVAPFIAYLHIVDADGCDGEGVQIGKGDVDFNKLKYTLDENSVNAPFIPEVWQGHINNGEGFRAALEFLSGIKF